MSVDETPFSEYANKLFKEMTEKGYIFAQPSWPRNSGEEITFKEISEYFLSSKFNRDSL